jgi:hypothetical protein
MNYLYHRVPDNMEGGTLFPLNMLKEKYPELYAKQMSKYEGREHVTKQFIPGLECLWNDVLHLSAVHPQDIKQSLIEAGMPDYEMRYYQIDPLLLEPEKTTVYLYAHKVKEDNMKPENFAEYVPSEINKYSVLSQETQDYYKEMYGNHQRPLLFVRIPHILYKGTIDVSLAPIITV